MLYLHLFSSFFHFRLYSTSRISDIAVPRFLCLTLLRLALSSKLFDCENNRILRRELAEATDIFVELGSY